jgi:CDP-diacylglycerol--glycerol-3-phosphate 3-phosphatidyltransferase
MKTFLPNALLGSVLLSSSVMSSSFSAAPSASFGRSNRYVASTSRAPSFVGSSSSAASARRIAAVLRGGDIENDVTADDVPLSPEVPSTSSIGNGGEQQAVVATNTPSTTSSTTTTTSSSSKLGPNAPPPGLLRSLFPSFPWHSLPNYLTYARCLSIPLFLLLSYYPTAYVNRAPALGVIFALASITDWFDGFLARRWDITSPFGAFLDPVADKLMVSTALIVLSGRYGGIVAIPSSIIMAREVGVSALREWMAQRGKRDSVKVGMQGKVKAALTMISISLLLLVPEGVGLESVGWANKYLGVLGVGGVGHDVVEGVTNAGCGWLLGPSLLMLFASAVVTVTSGSVYFKAAAPVLLGKE